MKTEAAQSRGITCSAVLEGCASQPPAATEETRGLVGVGGVLPYYSHAGITIYHGDCRTIMPHLQSFDLLLTDPPYGIGEARGKNKSRSCMARSKDYGNDDWDDKPVEEWVMFLVRRLCQSQIIWGGNYYGLPPATCWLVWDKENGENDFADCELAWTNLPKAVRRIRHQWHGMIRKGGEDRWHPTQKPLDVIAWALRQAPDDVRTVLDPWMGSGTTLRACKDHGKECVGIEREEKWCEIAAKRLEQEALPLGGGGAEQASDAHADTGEKPSNAEAHTRDDAKPRSTGEAKS